MWTRFLTELVQIGSGILAGGLVMVAASDLPVFRALSPGAYIQVHQTKDRYIDRYMPHTAVVTVLAGLALAVLRTGTWARALVVAGVLLTVGVGVISETGNKPINRKVQSWDPAAPPPEVADVRRRWPRFHLWRTAAGTLALITFAAAAALE
jgi:hypothetical protein